MQHHANDFNGAKSSKWLRSPGSEHIVQFYPTTDALLRPLTEYFAAGLKKGDSCIVICKPAHLKELQFRLERAGIDVQRAESSGQFTALDAAGTLDTFMKNGLPDKSRYDEVIGSQMDKLAVRGKPIRAYGEMVALLWEVGNKEAVIRLESLWNGLAKKYHFALYCAYPALHFILDDDARDSFESCHKFSLTDAIAA